MPASTHSLDVCLALTRAIDRASHPADIHAAALRALEDGLGITRSSILLFDQAGIMRFVAWRGLSDAHRRAVDGHSPWLPGAQDAFPIVVEDVRDESSLAAYLPALEAEGIRSLAFIPLVCGDGVIGKFMLYGSDRLALDDEALAFVSLVASQVAFAVRQTAAELRSRRNEEHLRFVLGAASMGTWEWDLRADTVEWSEKLAQLHGLPAGAFDGTFASYEREIHPADREHVLASVRRAIDEDVPLDVEYRIVGPDGSVRWVEGKGRVEYEDGRPVRMSGVCIMATRRKEEEGARLAGAEAADRTKDQFLATLSHELRTPLNAILGWVQLLQADALSAARTAQAIDIIGRNARLQARLIEDILDISRIITGKLDVEMLPVSLPTIFETVLTGIAPAAEAGQIVLDTRIAPGLPVLEGDPRRLQQVLGDVLSNAVKFTPPGGRIECACTSTPTQVTIEVTDTGVGVDPAFLPHMFERFRQGDSRSTRQHGGLGLGLAIAQYLIGRHDGTITAHSDGPGRGTRVTIVLPVPASRRHAASAGLAGDGAQYARCLDGAVVLVVDDEQDSRDLIAAVMESAGAQATVCASAGAALASLAAAPVDLIVADIAMPDVDGVTLMQEVRRSHRHVPAIAVSAHARLVDRRRAMKAGYDAYHTKPLDAARLVREALHLLGSRGVASRDV